MTTDAGQELIGIFPNSRKTAEYLLSLFFPSDEIYA